MSEQATVPVAPQQSFRVVIPGENGAGDEVFEAQSQEELVEKLRIAKQHATRKIREQEQELTSYRTPQPEPEPVPAVEGQFDKNEYFRRLTDDPVAAQDYLDKFRYGVERKEFLADYQKVRQASVLAWQNQVNAAFVHKHPELLLDNEDNVTNAKVITDIISERKWDYSVDNLEAAYALAKVQGKLKLPAAPAPATEPESVPTVLTNAPSAGSTASVEEEKFLRTAPLADVRAHLERKQQMTQR